MQAYPRFYNGEGSQGEGDGQEFSKGGGGQAWGNGSPPEPESKCEISAQFLTFSRTKFII